MRRAMILASVLSVVAVGLLIAHGSQDEVTRARGILHTTSAVELEVHAGEPAMHAA